MDNTALDLGSVTSIKAEGRSIINKKSIFLSTCYVNEPHKGRGFFSVLN